MTAFFEVEGNFMVTQSLMKELSQYPGVLVSSTLSIWLEALLIHW